MKSCGITTSKSVKITLDLTKGPSFRLDDPADQALRAGKNRFTVCSGQNHWRARCTSPSHQASHLPTLHCLILPVYRAAISVDHVALFDYGPSISYIPFLGHFATPMESLLSYRLASFLKIMQDSHLVKRHVGGRFTQGGHGRLSWDERDGLMHTL